MEHAFQASLVINVFEVEQNDNVFYIGKIMAKDLVKIATVHVRNTNENYDRKYLKEVKEKLNDVIDFRGSDDGIQRHMQQMRLIEISNYIIKNKGILPNTLIIALNSKVNWDEDGYIKKSENGFRLIRANPEAPFLILQVDVNKVDAFIVDGQHRLASFAYAPPEFLNNFELPVSIFLDMQIPLQAELFGTINGKQKPVNKSLLYDLTEFNPNEYDEIKRCHAIAKWFNINKSSPFFGKIKMLGKGSEPLSQSAFIDELIPYVKQRRANPYKSILRDKSSEEVIKILYIYFKVFKESFFTAWEDQEKYLLTRAMGFGTIMKLLYYIYIYIVVNQKQFEPTELKPLIEKIKMVTDFSTESLNQGSSQGLQSNLSNRIRVALFKDEKYIEDLENQYKEQYYNNI